MHGRSATARSLPRATDSGTGELRRRVAVAVARRFGGSARQLATNPAPASAPRIAPAAVSAIVPAHEPEADILALDARVRETGEW